MFESYERLLERLARRVHFALLSRLNPALARVNADKDRMWVLWFASVALPSWVRYLTLFILVFAGPLTVTLIVLAVDTKLRLVSPGNLPYLLLAAWLGGFAVTGIIIEAVRRPQLRRQCFKAMRISGHDVCVRCGYDMSGHEAESEMQRQCPECGGTVPPAMR